MSSGGSSHSLVARLYTQRSGEPWNSLSSMVRSASGTMPSEGIEGHEWGAYVVLDTFLRDGTWDGLWSASVRRVAHCRIPGAAGRN